MAEEGWGLRVVVEMGWGQWVVETMGWEEIRDYRFELFSDLKVEH